MKRYGNLFEKICSMENILLAHQNARKGKTNYREVQKIDKNPEQYARLIKEMLETKKFTTSDYEVFWKNCGTKNRKIYKLPYFPDRIVQHAIMQILEPIFTKTFIRDTFQSIKGRGTHDCRKRLTKAIQKCKTDDVYVLKFDIKKFYPSIDNDIMKTIVRKKIKCKDTLWLLDNIIDSTTGLPIGNYSSQILGNLYLSELDHYAKETLGIKHYFRYCDDIVILSNSKEKCHEYKNKLFQKVKNLNLSIKENWQIFPLEKRPIDFVGWRFSKESISLRKTTGKNFSRKTKYIKRNHKTIDPTHAISSIMSYWGQFKYVHSKKLWYKHIDNELIVKSDKFFTDKNILRD